MILLFAAENSGEPPPRRGFSRAIEVASEAPVKPAIIPLMPAENSAGTAGKRRTSPLGCDDQMGRSPGRVGRADGSVHPHEGRRC